MTVVRVITNCLAIGRYCEKPAHDLTFARQLINHHYTLRTPYVSSIWLVMARLLVTHVEVRSGS